MFFDLLYTICQQDRFHVSLENKLTFIAILVLIRFLPYSFVYSGYPYSTSVIAYVTMF